MRFGKRFLMIFCSVALLVGMLGGGSVAAADEPAKEQVVLTYEDLFSMSQEEVSKIDPDTIQKLYEVWIKEQREKINNALRPNDIPMTRSTTVTMGTDQSFYYSEVGNTYEYTAGLDAQAEASYSLGSNRNNEWTQVFVQGDAIAASYTGVVFYVSGSGSQSARLYATGDAKAYLGGWVTGNNSWYVTFKLWDATVEEWVGQDTLFSVSSNLSGESGGYYYGDIYYPLEGGHWYTALVQTEAISSMFAIGLPCYIEADTDSRNTDWNWMYIDWL